MKANQLSLKFEKKDYFFKEFSFQLEEGKMHALHGKNGIGKSVLLNLLVGQVPHKGKIEGTITGNQDAVLVNQRYDAMIADQFSFYENLRFASLPFLPSFFSRLNKPFFIPSFLEKFNIDIHQPVNKLSGGQRQILALSMSLQKKRNFLLLDEPTAALDEENASLVFNFLKTLTHVTFLIVCHDRELINQYANGCHLNLSMKNGQRTLVSSV